MSPVRAPHVTERLVWRSPRVLATGEAPSLIGFRSDDFMAQLEASLVADPPTTGTHVARPEHWEDTQPPLFSVPARPKPAAGTGAGLKLYQPAHGRFYLVAAHLCCRRYGFPDRRLSGRESVGFVLRRVERTTSQPVDSDDTPTFIELAWVPAGSGGAWQEVTDRHALAPGEELLPLVPTVHTVEGRRSRLLTGLIPVGARERYEARGRAVVALTTAREDGDLLANPHAGLLEESVIAAFNQLDEFPAASAPEAVAARSEMLRWALLDLVDFIKLVARGNPEAVADARLATVTALPEPKTTWAKIVKLVAEERDDLLKGDAPSDDLSGYLAAVNNLEYGGLVAALGSYRDSLPNPTPVTVSAPVPEPDPVRGLLYVARCVYQNPDCRLPRPEWVSAPSVPFRFASFFDPDAPARPVQISLPIDTSPGGLRSFPRNVSVFASKQLRAQIAQVKGLDDIDEKGKPFDLGMLCTLSIPIITICALILLMVVVSILNIVFFWMPLFKICLPKPGGDG